MYDILENIMREQSRKTEDYVLNQFYLTFNKPINKQKLYSNSHYRRLFKIYLYQGKRYYTFCSRIYCIIHEPRLNADNGSFTMTQEIETPQTKQYVHNINGVFTVTESRTIRQR